LLSLNENWQPLETKIVNSTPLPRNQQMKASRSSPPSCFGFL
jgi:hypothetical protein